MRNLIDKVKEFFAIRDIKPEENKMLVACSGGIDSMTLAHLLKALNCEFSLVHCNFKLRTNDSDLDESFVKGFGKTNGIQTFVQQFETKSYADSKKISIQMAARELRYSYFNSLLEEHQFNYLLTAHHLDDSLETLLINLGRGTGISGLAGIPSSKNFILRPLHQVNRKEIVQYVETHKIAWREDVSNQKDDYQRNFIRHHISPKLKETYKGYESGFVNSLSNISMDVELFQHQLRNILNKITFTKENKVHLNIKKLLQYPSIPSILNFWLNPYGNFDLKAIEKSLNHNSGKTFQTKSYTLLLDRGYLVLSKNIDNSKGINQHFINETDLFIEEPLGLEVYSNDNDIFDIPRDKNIAALDKSKLSFPLYLRKWKEGDRFIPLGMEKSKKISDFFIDNKLSLFEKSEAWLLCSGDDIIWVIGYRINDDYKITSETKSTYFVRLLK